MADIHHIEHIHRKHCHKANGPGASHNQHVAHDAAGGKAGLVASARRGGPVHSCSVWAVLCARAEMGVEYVMTCAPCEQGEHGTSALKGVQARIMGCKNRV